MSGKVLKTVLTVSISINVLFVGLYVGHIYKRVYAHPWFEIKKELSPETRNIVGRHFQAAYREIRPLGFKARDKRKAIMRILTAEEFDVEAFEKAANELGDIQAEIMAKKIDATKDIAGQLSLTERELIAKRMSRMLGARHKKRGRQHEKWQKVQRQKGGVAVRASKPVSIVNQGEADKGEVEIDASDARDVDAAGESKVESDPSESFIERLISNAEAPDTHLNE